MFIRRSHAFGLSALTFVAAGLWLLRHAGPQASDIATAQQPSAQGLTLRHERFLAAEAERPKL
jgi:hypothetical protein